MQTFISGLGPPLAANQLMSWCNENRVTINVKKTKHMVVLPLPSVSMDESVLLCGTELVFKVLFLRCNVLELRESNASWSQNTLFRFSVKN